MLRVCMRCFAMVDQTRPPRLCWHRLSAGRICCGSVFAPPGMAPWKLSRDDRTFLRSLRIAAEGVDVDPPVTRV